MAGYIAIPLKKTSEVDLIKPLTTVFAGLYTGQDEKHEYSAALHSLNSMRKNATWKTLDKHQSSLDAIASYYDQLISLEQKVPAHDVQISFKWKDAFDKGGFFGVSNSLTLMCLGYEKSCILFNYGAMLTQIAASQGADTTNDESLKVSAKYFQMAAGVYHHLRSSAQTITQESLTADLHPDTLTVLYTLCLAQAQECFYHKATKDGKRDVLLAQVASQCEELYADLSKLMGREQLRSLWDREWFTVVQLKEAAFRGATQYHKALGARADKEVGEELARLQVALDNFKIVQTKKSQVQNIQIGDHFMDLQRRANRFYEETKKDNDFIYHARIPEVKQLTTIKPAVLAKAIALTTPLMQEKREDLFESLLPVSVSQGCQKLEAKKNETVNEEIGRLKQATQMLNGVLASLNLPAAIEDVPGGTQLPPSIQQKAQEVRSKGGVKALEDRMSELGPQLQRNREIIDESQRMLDDEEHSDNVMKNQFKEKWTRLPSTKLNQTMRETVNKYRSIIEKAVEADKVVHEKFQAHRYSILLLGGSENELSGNIPKGNTGSSGVTGSPEVATLRELMKEVDRLISEREVIEFELKSATVDMKQRFLQALSADGAINETALTAEALGQALGPLQQRVRESLASQETLIPKIQSAHQEFTRRTGGSGDKREDVLKNLAAAHSAFNEIMGNLNEGLKFYGELTNLLLNHQTKINDFCFARRTEKEELVKDLTKALAGEASLPAGSLPPSQPAYQTSQASQPTSTSSSTAPTSTSATAPLPYPNQPAGMPQPAYAYQYPAGYPMFQVPMPGGYNPYAMPPGYQPPQQPQYQPQYMQYPPGVYQPPPPPQ